MDEGLDDLAAVVMAHTAIITAVIGALQNKGLLDQADVNEIVDLALLGAETAVGVDPALNGATRKILERTAGALAGRRGG